MRLLRAFLLAGICGLSAPVWAGSSSISWPEWDVNSTEELGGASTDGKVLLHPLSGLFDANPRTTWVMNPKATLEPIYGAETDEKFFSKTKRGLMISGKSQFMSGLQIMNGDNSSRRAFQTSNRIRSLKITLLNGKKRRTYTLPLKNQMGWQRVAWPRQKADGVAIEFAEMVKVGKPVCSSGLGLLDGAREIKWNMPQFVMFWDGAEGCGADLLLDRQGRILEGVSNEMGNSADWSKDGRLVAGFGGDRNRSYIWVADVKLGKVIKKIMASSQDDEVKYVWIANRQLKVDWSQFDKKDNLKPLPTQIYRF